MSRRFTAVGALVVLCASLVTGTAATAAGKPDLVVATIGAPPETLQPGWGFVTTAKVSNKGSAASKATAIRFYVSGDATKSGDDSSVGRAALKGIKPRKSGTVNAAVALPDDIPTGTYNFIACADDPSKNREKSEGNNCKAAASTLEVVAPTAPNPQNVTPTLDTSAAVTEIVGSSGGEITTESSNGTTYTLTFPDNALMTDEEITMTPVTSLAGLPLASLGGAVQLQPEGLVLFEVATLTIEPATSIPVANQRGFAAEGSGEDFYTDYLSPEQDVIELSLTNFSIHGVGASPDAGASTRVPGTPEGRARQAIAETLADAKVGGDITSGHLDQMEGPLRDWFNERVAPDLANAGSSNAATDAAIKSAMKWAKTVHDLGMEDRFTAEKARMDRIIEQLLKNAINRAATKCVKDKDPTAALDLMTYGKAYTLLGFDAISESQIIQKMNNCLRFELRFTSNLTWVNEGFSWAGTLSGKVTLQSLFAPGQLIGLPEEPNFVRGPLTFTDQCGAPTNRTSQAFPIQVPEAFFGWKWIDGRVADRTPKIWIRFPAPLVMEGWTVKLGEDCEAVSGQVSYFTVPFGAAHEHELVLNQGTYSILNWEILNGDPYAQKVYEQSFPIQESEGGTGTESTKFELFHKPVS